MSKVSIIDFEKGVYRAVTGVLDAFSEISGVVSVEQAMK